MDYEVPRSGPAHSAGTEGKVHSEGCGAETVLKELRVPPFPPPFGIQTLHVNKRFQGICVAEKKKRVAGVGRCDQDC